MRYAFEARIWVYPGEAGWHFVSVPKLESDQIQKLRQHKVRRGFGAVKVEVTLGASRWTTSIFPDKKSGQYLLPLKAAVRKKEGVFVSDTIALVVRLL